MKITPEEFARLTLEETVAGLAGKRFAAADLAEASLARMAAFEPAVNAMISTFPEETRKRAAAVDAAGGIGALRGAPVAIKDNIMATGMLTTCGSRILENFVPPYDACVVEKLNASGAVIPGKANMDEFAMGSTGENSAFGPTRNPWDLSRVTGGSSSGSAAVVAYGGCPAALASDTGGSIRQPASFCGLVGVKPTYGRVSRWGVGALASSLDQVGVMTKTVRDNALMLDAISGYDKRDSTSAAAADTAEPCLPGIEAGIKGLRVVYDPSMLEREGMGPDQANALRQAVAFCKNAGAEIGEVKIPHIDYGVAAYYLICFCEASANMARFDGVRYGVRRGDGGLWDVYSATRGDGFGDEVKRRIMLGSYALSKGYYDAYYLKAARVRRLFATEFAAILEKADVILMPVAPQAPKKVGQKATLLEGYLGDIFTLAANLTGLPALAFPMGVHGGLPVGVQALSAAFRESVLYRVARAAEKQLQPVDAPWLRPQPEGSK